MEPAGSRQKGLCVAVTGASGDLGRLLLPQLERDPGVTRIVVFDIAAPTGTGPKVEFRHVDLTRPGADEALSSALQSLKVDALYHLAFHYGPRMARALVHELEVAGTLQVLAAVSRAGTQRIVIQSLTAVYGAFPDNPAFLREESPLRGCPRSRMISDKVEVEQQVRAFRTHHPERKVFLLRFAAVVGARMNNPLTRLLRGRVLPTLLGFDPLWQVLHEEDAAQALLLALRAERDGEFNIVSKGVLPLSGMARQAGGRVVPLPQPVARGAIRALNATGALMVPLPLLNYVHFNCIADARRAEEVLGYKSRYHARDAVAELRG
jgi:UDP-glucose 4-epimerase